MLALFDLSKAYDSVDHQLLCWKVSDMGIRGVCLKLIRAYLTNRKQLVQMPNSSELGGQTVNSKMNGLVVGNATINFRILYYLFYTIMT